MIDIFIHIFIVFGLVFYFVIIGLVVCSRFFLFKEMLRRLRLKNDVYEEKNTIDRIFDRIEKLKDKE